MLRSDYLSKESLFEMCVHSLYQFATKFPYFLRNWKEEHIEKKYSKLTEQIIKNFISYAIYLNEVEVIELRSAGIFNLN